MNALGRKKFAKLFKGVRFSPGSPIPLVVRQYPANYSDDLDLLVSVCGEMTNPEIALAGTHLSKTTFLYQAVFTIMQKHWNLQREHDSLKARFIEQSKELSKLKRK